jgi:hypothetical protein
MSKKAEPDRPKTEKRDRKSNPRKVERDLDEGLEETFPASDPLAITDPVVDVLKDRRKT